MPRKQVEKKNGTKLRCAFKLPAWMYKTMTIIAELQSE